MNYAKFAADNAREEFEHANCGCVYHAEEGTLCIHDKALNFDRLLIERDRLAERVRKLEEWLERITDSHERLERERGSMVGTLTYSARTLLAEKD